MSNKQTTTSHDLGQGWEALYTKSENGHEGLTLINHKSERLLGEMIRLNDNEVKKLRNIMNSI